MIKKRRTRAQWQQLLQQWQKSELTVSEFCQQQRLTESNFYLWRKKLQVENTSIQSTSPDWLDISEQPSPEALQVWYMELSLPGGAVLRIRQN